MTYLANRLEINVLPVPGIPQKATIYLSVVMGKMLNGIEFSIVCPTAALATMFSKKT